ncbi:winged helix-turn-helix transcriptional regulator [Pedobacter petrophilus]|nr:helix-turn-helix domain-containing protein [Pedobacter petrophilus]
MDLSTHSDSTMDGYICTVKQQDDIKFAQDALYVLTGKWRMQIIISIYNGQHRYREIARYLPGLSFAMLSRELQIMELNVLVSRTEDPDFPKQVSYTLTDYCQSLYPLINNLISWGREHRETIKLTHQQNNDK